MNIRWNSLVGYFLVLKVNLQYSNQITPNTSFICFELWPDMHNSSLHKKAAAPLSSLFHTPEPATQNHNTLTRLSRLYDVAIIQGDPVTIPLPLSRHAARPESWNRNILSASRLNIETGGVDELLPNWVVTPDPSGRCPEFRMAH